MKIIKSEDKKWQEKQGYSKKVFLDETDLNNKGSQVQEVKIKSGEAAKEHYHKIQTEIFYFLTENGYWVINGKKMSFKKGEILVIEPMDKHEVVNNTSEDYIYLCFKIKYVEGDLYYREGHE